MGKTSDEATELALRSAVSRNRPDGKPPNPEDILKEAKTRWKDFSNDGNLKKLATGLTDQQTVQSLVIKAAVGGLTLACNRISEESNTVKQKRDELSDEIRLGFSSFNVPESRPKEKLSPEQKVIMDFCHLANDPKNPWLTRYLGIRKKDPKEVGGKTYYYVLPFFGMSKGVGQPLASPRLVDVVRTEINLFLRGGLPETIKAIEAQFKQENEYLAIAKSCVRQGNYLNNWRAARFLVMSLGNLLWNLQHPVDLETGFPLITKDCIILCRRVEIFLNALLNSDAPPFLSNKTPEEIHATDFIRSADLLVKNLRFAYAEEQLNELNISDLTNSARKGLHTLNNALFQLLYRRYDPIEKKMVPDSDAANVLASDLSELKRLLKQDNTLFEPFQDRVEQLPAIDFLNGNVTTLIDVLIVFCHLPYSKRKALRYELKARMEDEGASQVARILKSFNERFITPIEHGGKTYTSRNEFLSAIETISGEYERQKALLVGQRLIPFLTLLIEAFRIDVDTSHSCESARTSQRSLLNINVDSLNPEKNMQRTGKQQVTAINEQASQVNQEVPEGFDEVVPYFAWRVSAFIYTSGVINTQIDELPKQQYRMTQITQLLDAIAALLTNYRTFLQHKVFQSFLVECLQDVRKEYMGFEQTADQAGTRAREGKVSRHLQGILLPMVEELDMSLEDFQSAANNFERIVSDPGFIDKERAHLTDHVHFIHARFWALFHKESQLLKLLPREEVGRNTRMSMMIFGSPLTPITAAMTPRSVSRGSSQERRELQVFALKMLMRQCYDSMSYLSKQGYKGELLNQLIDKMNTKTMLTETEVKDYLRILVRLVSSYRQTYFFQAKYGETRSAQALIAAIKNRDINTVLPFSAVIGHDKPCDFTLLSDAQLITKLQETRDKNDWEDTVDDISEEDLMNLGSNHASPSKDRSSDRRVTFSNARGKSQRFSMIQPDFNSTHSRRKGTPIHSPLAVNTSLDTSLDDIVEHSHSYSDDRSLDGSVQSYL